MLIAQLTDLHIRPRGEAANRVVETNVFAAQAFRAVACMQRRPDVVLLTGDLTELGQAAEYQYVADLLRSLPMPVFVIPGNHDQRENLREVLAPFPGVRSDPDFVQYAIEDLPVRLVMLDTLVPGAAHGELCPQRLDFLARTLRAAPDRPTMIAMHHPPFDCGIEHMDKIGLRNARAFIDIVAHNPQVQRIVCGHVHRSVFTQLAQAVVSIAPSVAHQVELTFDPADEGAFVFEPPAFHLHLWRVGTGFVTHTAYVDRFSGPFPFLSHS